MLEENDDKLSCCEDLSVTKGEKFERKGNTFWNDVKIFVEKE